MIYLAFVRSNLRLFKFVQVHVVMNDGEGLADAFEEKMASISGVGEIEVISMGLL